MGTHTGRLAHPPQAGAGPEDEHPNALARQGAWAAWLTRFAVLLVRAYQVSIRPLLFGTCKFCPTCSEYAITALQRHGLIGGGTMALRRLLRCHPFGSGGIDPVPE